MKIKVQSKGLFLQIDEFQFLKDPKKDKPNLGVGSFGEVKLGLHKKTGKYYAIKVMNLKTMNNKSELNAIEREIRVHFTLNNPYIIKLYECFIENDFVYMIMDWAQNGNLYSYLYKKKQLSEHEAFKYFYQTCNAIQYLHDNGILHRDIKPENLLLDQDFNIKLCDFGWISEDFESQRNTFCGTYEYMAPEIVFHQPYDYRIDVWALGILLYELIHGKAPFKGKTFRDVQTKIKTGDVSFNQQVSDQAKLLIARILQSDPQRRISLDDIYQSQWVKQMLKYEKQNISTIPQQNNNIKQNKDVQIESQLPDTQDFQIQMSTESTSVIVNNAIEENLIVQQNILKRFFKQEDQIQEIKPSQSKQNIFTDKQAIIPQKEENILQKQSLIPKQTSNLEKQQSSIKIPIQFMENTQTLKSQKKIKIKVSDTKEIVTTAADLNKFSISELDKSKSKPFESKPCNSLNAIKRKFSSNELQKDSKPIIPIQLNQNTSCKFIQNDLQKQNGTSLIKINNQKFYDSYKGQQFYPKKIDTTPKYNPKSIDPKFHRSNSNNLIQKTQLTNRDQNTPEHVKGRSQTIFQVSKPQQKTLTEHQEDMKQECKPTTRKNKKIFDTFDINATKIISIDIDIMKDTVQTNYNQKSKRSRVAIFADKELYYPKIFDSILPYQQKSSNHLKTNNDFVTQDALNNTQRNRGLTSNQIF